MAVRADRHVFAVLCAALAAGGCVEQQREPLERAGAPIVNGTPTTDDPAVVAIASRRTKCLDDPEVRCSGTLIAPRVVLTAAHCLTAIPRRGALEVFIGSDVAAGGELIVVSDHSIHPGFDSDTNDNDVGLLLLAEPASVEPVPLPTGSVDDLAAAAVVRAVGFGVTDRALDDRGAKREGTMELAAVRAGSFDAVPGPGMTCVGDSGGPVFADIGGSEQLIGITSKGDFQCETNAFNQRVDVVLDDFVTPFVDASADAPPGWPPEALALEDVGELPCTQDEDCPALMACIDGPEGELRCALPGLGAGAFYPGDCTIDRDCTDPERVCARVWPTGDDACRCYGAAVVPPMLPDAGLPDAGDDEGGDAEGGCGCAAAGARSRGPAAGGAVLVLALVLLAAGRRRRGAVIAVIAVALAGTATPAAADEAAPAGRGRPFGIAKVGAGLPGFPGIGAEVFVADRATAQLELGTGAIGDYFALSARWRPCWGCRGNHSFAIGLGPELTIIFEGDDERTGIIPAVLADAVYAWRPAENFGLAFGLKYALGPEWDLKDGEVVAFDIANTFAIYLGVVL